MFNDYEKLLLDDASKEAIAKEKEFLANGSNIDSQLNEESVPWVGFHIGFKNFPQEVLILNGNDVSIVCGRLYKHGDKYNEITSYPFVVFPSSISGCIGASGRYAADGTMGRITLREYSEKTKQTGDEVLSILWRCLSRSYMANFFHAYTRNPNYIVKLHQDYPKDCTIGRQNISVTRK